MELQVKHMQKSCSILSRVDARNEHPEVDVSLGIRAQLLHNGLERVGHDVQYPQQGCGGLRRLAALPVTAPQLRTGVASAPC